MKNKNCIIYLLKASQEDMNEFPDSVNSLKNYFLNNNKADIFCYHEKDLLPYLSSIKQKLQVNVSFIEINFEIPNHNKHLDIPEYYPHPTHGNGPVAWGHPGFDMGYRHMCRFFAGEVFKRPELDDYKYYMRMDSDSFILREVNYDVFKYMEDNNKKYGFIAPAVQFDNPKVGIGLWEQVHSWYLNNKNKCLLEPIKQIEQYKIYYTNFEICDITWFRSPEYTEYYDFVDRLGGIYTTRWGDHIIRYLGVNMLMPEENKYGIYNIAYKHGASYNI